MRHKSVLMVSGVASALFLAMLVAAGCGGGGPLAATPVTTVTLVSQFTQLQPAVQKSATRVGAAACARCHAADNTSWALTRHAQVSVDCESCHGPGSVHSAAPSKTNILRGNDVTNAVVCGQCHNTEYGDYSASKHAQIVSDAVNAGSGTCFRCHSAPFRANNVDEPLGEGQTATQVNTGITSLAAADLQAYIPVTTTSATCANCHDPHRNTTNLTSAGEQFYLRRATSNTDLTNTAPNASVALYTTTDHICGSCHNNRGGNPSDAGLQANTVRPATHEGPEYNMLLGEGGAEDVAGPPTRQSSHAGAPDQCVQCHMPNSRHTFTVSLDTSCAPCHTSADAAARESSVQGEIQNDLVALRTRMSNWAKLTFGDASVWDYTSNIVAPSVAPKQTLIPIEVKRARHNYYFVLLDRSLGVHNTPYARYLLNYANVGLDNIGIARSANVPGLTQSQNRSILAIDMRKIRSSNAHSAQ